MIPNRPVLLYIPEQCNLRHRAESCFSVMPDTTIAVWSCSQILTRYWVSSWARTAYALTVFFVVFLIFHSFVDLFFLLARAIRLSKLSFNKTALSLR